MSNRASALECLAVWAKRAIIINRTIKVGAGGRELNRVAKNHCEAMIGKILVDLGEIDPPEQSGSYRPRLYGVKKRGILDTLKDDLALTKAWGSDPYLIVGEDELQIEPRFDHPSAASSEAK